MRILFLDNGSSRVSAAAEQWAAYGLTVEYAIHGAEGRQLARSREFDCLVLDQSEAGGCRPGLCQELRRDAGAHLPLIVLGDAGPVERALAAFDAGADDYLRKPFDPRELAARIKALHRRTNGGFAHNNGHAGSDKAEPRLLVADLEHNPATCETFRGGRPVRLGRAGRRLLALLMRESPRVVTRERLEFEIWGDAVPSRDLLRSHLSTLRLAVDGRDRPKLIHTVHRVGIRLA